MTPLSLESDHRCRHIAAAYAAAVFSGSLCVADFVRLSGAADLVEKAAAIAFDSLDVADFVRLSGAADLVEKAPLPIAPQEEQWESYCGIASSRTAAAAAAMAAARSAATCTH